MHSVLHTRRCHLNLINFVKYNLFVVLETLARLFYPVSLSENSSLIESLMFMKNSVNTSSTKCTGFERSILNTERKL